MRNVVAVRVVQLLRDVAQEVHCEILHADVGPVVCELATPGVNQGRLALCQLTVLDHLWAEVGLDPLF